eukprot:6174862-Pleurochrysis_carterae.AAC.3
MVKTHASTSTDHCVGTRHETKGRKGGLSKADGPRGERREESAVQPTRVKNGKWDAPVQRSQITWHARARPLVEAHVITRVSGNEERERRRGADRTAARENTSRCKNLSKPSAIIGEEQQEQQDVEKACTHAANERILWTVANGQEQEEGEERRYAAAVVYRLYSFLTQSRYVAAT